MEVNFLYNIFMDRTYKYTTVSSKKHLVRSLDTFTMQYNFVYLAEDLEVADKYMEYEKSIAKLSTIKKTDKKYKSLLHKQKVLNRYKRMKYHGFEIIKENKPYTFKFVLERDKAFSVQSLNKDFLIDKVEYQYRNSRGAVTRLNKAIIPEYIQRYVDKQDGAIIEEKKKYVSYYRKKTYNLENTKISLKFSDTELDRDFNPKYSYSQEEALLDLQNVKLIEDTIELMLNIKNDPLLPLLLKRTLQKYKESLFFIGKETVLDFMVEKGGISKRQAQQLYSQLKNRIKYKNFGIYSDSYSEKKKQTITPEFNLISLYLKEMYEFIHLKYHLVDIIFKEAPKNIDNILGISKDTFLSPNGILNLRQYHILFEKVLAYQNQCKLFKKLLKEYQSKPKDYQSVFHNEQLEKFFSKKEIKIEMAYIDYLMKSILKDKDAFDFIEEICSIDFMNLSIHTFMNKFLELFYPQREDKNKVLKHISETLKNARVVYV